MFRNKSRRVTIAAILLCLFLLGIMPVGITLGQEATEDPTQITQEPTAEVTEIVTEAPTEAPTAEPTEAVTEAPTAEATEVVTEVPTEEATEIVTEEPVATPTEVPTDMFSDNFQDGDTAGWQISGWQVATDGGNSFLMSSDTGSIAAIAGVDWPHLLLSAQIRVNEGSSLLVNMRNGVSISIDAAGQADLLINGAVVAEGTPVGAANSWRQLNIQLLGSTITVAVERVFQINAVEVGQPVAGALSFSNATGIVAIDDVTVNKLDEPVSTPEPIATATPEIILDLNETELGLLAQAQANGTVRVIVGLNRRYDLITGTGDEDDTQMGAQFQLAQQGRSVVLSGLQQTNAQVQIASESLNWVIPFVAMEVDSAGLQYLFTAPEVASVEEDRQLEMHLNSSLPVIGAPTVRTNGFTGAGQTVAVLDTGVQANHEFLNGRVVAEACFTVSFCPGSASTAYGAGAAYPSRCILYYGDNGCSHGTHVAGIIAGNNTSLSGGEPQYGVAPGASIIAVNVFSYGSSSGPGASDSNIISGLNYVYSQRNNFNIAAVNMSLGTSDGFTGKCDVLSPAMVQATKLLSKAKIATIVSSGNSNYSNGISYPACLSTVVSVGSTTDADAVSYFSNRANFLSLFAPGSSIQSSVLPGAYDYYNGTSMAAPHVAGAYAVLRQIDPNASLSKILSTLKSTGVKITISGGKKIPRINLAAAAGKLLPKLKKIKLTSPANKSFQNQTGYTFEWQAASGAGLISYEIQVSNVSNFRTINYTTTITGLSQYVSGFSEGRWYWRVRPSNMAGDGPWSSKGLFTLDMTPPGETTLVSPGDGGSAPTRPTLKWAKAQGANLYRVQIDNNSNFSSPEVDNSSIKNTSYKAPTLPAGTYYWRVLPLDSAGNNGGWTASRSFIIN